MSLGMLAETTGGNSRKQILSALGSNDIYSLRTQASKIWNYCYRKDGIANLLLANSLWLDSGIKYKQNALDNLTNNYYAHSFSGTMGSNELNELLRNWINEQTDNLLEDQVSGIEFTKDTVLSIVSTVNFTAKWDNTFKKEKTEQGVFHSPKGDVNVSYMKNSTKGTAYGGDKFTAISMPLAEKDYSMNIILPDKGFSVSDLTKDSQVLSLILNQKNYENRKELLINRTIPKFDVSCQMDPQNSLQDMGITDIFDSSVSDFSNVTEKENLTILAKHGTRVTIDEEGCKAVAYTVLSHELGIFIPEDEMDFVVDRPFIFTITDKTGTPFFVGIVNNP